MDHIAMSFMSGNAWSWLVLGLALVIAEVIAPTFWLLWPGLAALVIGLTVTVTGPFDWRVQALCFAALSIVLTLLGRRFVANRAKIPAEAPQLNRRAEQYKGRVVKVAEGFAAGRGRVRVDDTIWIAETGDGSNPALDEAVEVTDVQGTVLKVKRAAATP
jgi:membrane protein implicated in regulation of membrane protease activity